MHGLFENAIYGGRIDNYFDMKVLRSYLEQLFNSSVIGSLNARGRKRTSFLQSISLPNSCSILVSIHLQLYDTQTEVEDLEESLYPQRNPEIQYKDIFIYMRLLLHRTGDA